jgi:hypothetical protein
MTYKIKKYKNRINELSAWLADAYGMTFFNYVTGLTPCFETWHDDGYPIIKAKVIKSKLLQVLYV